MLAPFSGPVSRLLVSLGDQVRKGSVGGGGFTRLCRGDRRYRKALATAKTDRRLADLDKDLLQHHGVSQREAQQAETDAVNAEADREAALQTLVSLNVIRRPSKIFKTVGRFRARGNHSLADRRNVVEKLITPGNFSGGNHAVLHRRRPFARLGHGACLWFGSCFGRLGDPAES